MPRKKKVARRRFGKIRRLPSGRYQASYIGPDGLRRTAPETYEHEWQAEDWLKLREAELVRGDWTDPNRGKVPLSAYGRDWIAHRLELRPRTIDLYRWLFGKYIEQQLGHLFLSDISPATVRQWRSRLLESGVSLTMAAKAYRLLRSIMATAADDDELIDRNPCRIKAGGKEFRSERPVLTIRQVFLLAELVPDRYRALIVVSTFASLRFGEVTALRRRDVDIENGTVAVRQAYTEVRGKGLVLGPPKTGAGVRIVSIPAAIIPEVDKHLGEYVDDGPNALVFSGPKGAPIRRSNFNPLVGWVELVKQLGVPGLHFHDLRHTGNTLAASSGASTRDLMARMGHQSVDAALVYQHAT